MEVVEATTEAKNVFKRFSRNFPPPYPLERWVDQADRVDEVKALHTQVVELMRQLTSGELQTVDGFRRWQADIVDATVRSTSQPVRLLNQLTLNLG